jgi:replicative DNA helicase
MARSLNICIVAACQVSRQAAQSDGQIPRLSELRQSGQLEQDAFVVLAMGRKSGDTVTQVAIRKNRSGESERTIELVFDPEHTRFYSRAA